MNLQGSPTMLGRIHPIQMCLFILIELLLVFGKEFSKFHVAGPLYLYDLLLALTASPAIILLFRKKEKFIIWPLLALIALSLIYLAYSFLAKIGPLNYMIRHYALFGYLILVYLIFNSFANEETNEMNIQFIILLGILAFVGQLLFHIYNAVATSGYIEILFVDFNYLSLMVFPGLFIFQAYLLVLVRNRLKWLLLAIVWLFSFTMGHHSSTILCTLIVFSAYLILKSGVKTRRYLIPAFGVLIASSFFLIPQFLDTNSMWRYIYWKYTLKDIIENYFLIFGHGFGAKFSNPEVLEALKEQLNSPWMEVRPEEQYLSPMHNSFITMGFHIGFIPSMLVFVPLIRPFKYFFVRSSDHNSPQKDFLSVSLLSLLFWCSFHVMLELPHSSALFWLMYFTTIYHFKEK